MFSIFDEEDIVLFDEFGIYVDIEVEYDDYDPYYDDMFECNGVDYY